LIEFINKKKENKLIKKKKTKPKKLNSDENDIINIDNIQNIDENEILENLDDKSLDWAKNIVFSEEYETLKEDYSSKMKTLFEIIENSLELNEKVLVFSLYTQTIDVIESKNILYKK
jgi:SNF2 family DNA or RNA helicase